MPTAAKLRNEGRQEAVRLGSGRQTDGSVHMMPPQKGMRSRATLIGFSALLAVLTVALYSPIGKHPFVNYDDFTYVTDNAHVKAGLTWGTLTWSLSAIEEANWHPLTWLSHALDCQLYGLNASGHHWTSLLLHISNVLLLFLLLQRVTGATWRSLLLAGVFAIHPLNVESVAWVAERKNVLSTLFFLAALGAYGWYARHPGVGRYLAVAALFVMGLASKPMVITLPFVLLLLDFWPFRRVASLTQPSLEFPVPQFGLRRLILEKLPLLAICFGSAAITVIAQSQNVIPTVALPIGVRLRTVPYAYSMYLWKIFCPARLAPIYPHPGLTLPAWMPLVDLFFLLLISVLVWKARSRHPYLVVGWLWFLGTAVPIIGLIQVGNQVIADRYAYVPLIGVFLMLVWGISDLANYVHMNDAVRATLVLVVFIAFSFVSWRQISYWRSTVDLWQHALQVTSNNSLAENYLATELFREDRYDDAIIHLRNYAKLEPLDPVAHVRVAADFQDRWELPEAKKEFETGIRAANALNRRGLPGLSTDALAISYANLAVVYSALGDDSSARISMNRALQTDPAAVDHMMGRLVKAIAANRSAGGYLRLGYLLKLIGHGEEARQAFSWARRYDPRVPVPPGY